MRPLLRHRGRQKEAQRQISKGVTQGSLVMSHMFFIFTRILHTKQSTPLSAFCEGLWSSVRQLQGGGGGC